MQNRFAIYLGLATMWLMGGMGYPFLTDATEKLQPLNLVFIRTSGTALILLAILLVFRTSELKQIRWNRDLAITFICAMLFYPICSGSLAIASSKIPGALTALLYSTLPVISTIYLFIRGKKPSQKTMIGVAISLFAAFLLIGSPNGDVGLSGFFAGAISVFTWFVATEIWIKFHPNYSILIATTLQAIFGALGTELIRFFIGSAAISRSDTIYPSVIFLIFSLLAQHFAYLWLTTRVSRILLMLFSIINPFVAGITGYLLFKQQITLIQGIAGFILVSGVYLIIKNEGSAKVSA